MTHSSVEPSVARNPHGLGLRLFDAVGAQNLSLLAALAILVAIFGWFNSGVGVAGVPQIFGSEGGGNYNGYKNAKVDELANTLVRTLDLDEQAKIQEQIDPLLFADAYGLPLFQSVGLDAVQDRVGGIEAYNPSQSGVWWNVWDWTVTD